MGKVLLYVFCNFPLLAWAAWQLQYCSTAQQPVELSENILQNLLNMLPPQTVYILRTKRGGRGKKKIAKLVDVIYGSPLS